MIVSWKWLQDYVPLEMPADEMALRLAMSGLNHEGTESVGDDLAIDIEVTSNRPDCLGHIGIAREVAVLWDKPLTIPKAQPTASGSQVADSVKVSIECPELCPRYTARLVRGVKIGPSPQWMQDRLKTLGIASINNVVDISNYVMMECGQPLHAFDFAKINGGQIIVRAANAKEKFEAIDHKTYDLDQSMCVIADAKGSIALAGVMGGADSEVSESTVDILIEAADFNPLTTRKTSRALKLFSPSSYRFERTVDPEGIDWASRRCAELILEHAGGALDAGVVDVVARAEPDVPKVSLRLGQLERVLGIQIPSKEVSRILTKLGGKEESSDSEKIVITPPSWRRDCHREVDLIEEVARVHGYDKIPEDVGVTMVSSQKTTRDRVISKVRQAMTAVGYDEAMTASVIPKPWSEAMSLWSDQPALETITPMLRGASYLRRSIIPSLLNARKVNEAQQNEDVALFEVAKVYLPKQDGLPEEPWMLGVVSEGEMLEVKGALESMLRELTKSAAFKTANAETALCGKDCCQLLIDSEIVGYIGQVSPAGLKQFELRRPATFAEVRIDRLENIAELVPQYQQQSAFPAIRRDMNLIVAEAVRWSALADTVSSACGPLLDSIHYRETFRDEKKDGPGRKRLMFSYHLRADDRTLTREEAEEISRQVVDGCAKAHQAELVG